MDLSLIIVNYNVKYFLEQALTSLKKAASGLQVEYIVIDNASEDGSVDYIRENFHYVNLIANHQNYGFAYANNQGLQRAKGKYILIANPDTVVGEETLKILHDYLNSHPQVGAIGPKVIDRAGKFELGCRRGFPTPLSAFSKLTGLAALFPKNPSLAKYNLTYLDPDLPCEVDALSGAFMLIRREVYEQVGGFDEGFFMYGEDLDWCYRIKQANWKIYYLPTAQVIHYKGESAIRSTVDIRRAFFNAMRLFARKHYTSKFPLTLSLIKIGIAISQILDWMQRVMSKMKAPIADLLCLNLSLFFGYYFRFGIIPLLNLQNIYLLFIYNLGWLALFFAFGVYGRRKVSILNAFFATLAGMAFLFTFTYFFKQFAYSRFILLFTAFSTIFLIPGWRWLVLKLPRAKKVREWFKRRTLLIGVDELTEKIAVRATAEEDSDFKIIGLLDCGHKHLGERVAGAEVIGSVDELPQMVKKLGVEEVVFSGKSLSYSDMLKYIGSFNGKVGFKVIPETALETSDGEVPFLELGLTRKPNLLKRLRERNK